MSNDLTRDILEAEAEQDEITAQALAIDRKERKRLSIDELARMINITPRVEHRTPRTYPVDGVQKYAWIFSIDGWLDCVELKGCSLGDDFVVVFAATEKQARTLAHEGMIATTMHAYEHFYQENIERKPWRPDDGIIEDVGGRKMKAAHKRSMVADIVADVLKTRH